MGNKHSKKVKGTTKTLSDIEKYLESKNPLPCFLKTNNGNFEVYNNGFEKITLKDIKYEEMITGREFEFASFESELSSQNNGEMSQEAFLDITFYHCDASFNREAKNLQNYHIKKKSLVGKCILYKVSIDPIKIKLSPFIIDEINNIANSSKPNYKKAIELDKKFGSYGFFVPLQIYIGGMFSNNDENLKSLETNNSQINLKAHAYYKKNEGNFKHINLTKREMQEFFKSSQRKIKGGDIYKTDIDSWKDSLTVLNSEIIGYSNLKEITDFIPQNIKQKIEEPLEFIERKYEIRKKYCEVINNLKELKDNQIKKGNHDINVGICEEREIPKIYIVKYEAKGDGKFFQSINKRVSDSYEDIIVGYQIISCWGDGTNGDWSLKGNPLLKKSCDFSFESQLFRGERFKVNVYLMKFPE